MDATCGGGSGTACPSQACSGEVGGEHVSETRDERASDGGGAVAKDGNLGRSKTAGQGRWIAIWRGIRNSGKEASSGHACREASGEVRRQIRRRQAARFEARRDGGFAGARERGESCEA